MIYDNVRMSLNDTIEHIKNAKNSDDKVAMYTNPFNEHVIKLVFFKEYENGEKNYYCDFWIEQLTDNTESELLKLADEHQHGRFW